MFVCVDIALHTLQNILGIVDANGNVVVNYYYSAYGECQKITGSKATTIGVINSFRYKGYYFDAETEFFYCNARYYSPDFCRFISPDSAQYLEPENVNGLNLYAYCRNDLNSATNRGTIGNSTSVLGLASCGIAGYCTSKLGSSKYISNTVSITSNRKSSLVAMTHYTVKIVKDPVISFLLGNISTTVTMQMNEPNTFYYFIDSGNDGTNMGIGINAGDWGGFSVYSGGDGIGASWQLTPWTTHGIGLSVSDGLSISSGVVKGNMTLDTTVSIGTGALIGYALCATVAMLPLPGARIVAGTTSGIIFLLDTLI